MKPWAKPMSWLVALLILAGLGWWVARNTYWDDDTTRTPRSGAAITDDHYVLRQWLAAQRSTLTVVPQLSQLPPTTATLVLGSPLWDMQQQYLPAVRAWVEQGGHLVVMSNALGHEDEDPLLTWLELRQELPWEIRRRAKAAAKREAAQQGKPRSSDEAASAPQADDDEEEDEAEGEDEAPTHAQHSELTRLKAKAKCDWTASEPEGMTRHFPELARFELCTETNGVLRSARPPVWGVQDALGWRVVRLAVGRGQVTVSTDFLTPNADWHLERDRPALMTATLNLRAGDAVWLAETESLPALPRWLWTHAPATCGLLLLAATLALWRAVPRFGPLRRPPPEHRRSLAAQVQGTAAFLLHQRSPVLLQAQLRALQSAWQRHASSLGVSLAARTEPGRPPAWPELAAALAQATGLDARSLLEAGSNPDRPRHVRQLIHDLRLLETARRRLASAPRAPHSTGYTGPSP
ncbi:DUF4350 domain-containing protein [Ideonella sp.]|uniref:DUF4350 domain-containing protein n=1 Tax=Ideonella sp. TaxID=1929293 RepID=UPI003BB57627